RRPHHLAWTETRMPRRLLMPLCTVTAVAMLGGCGGGATPAGGAATPAGAGPASAPPASTAASPRSTGPRVDLTKTAPCTLATADEAAAALGVPVTKVHNSPPVEGIGCQYDTASNPIYLLIQVENDPD